MTEVPEGWVRVRLEDVVRINPPKLKPDYESGARLVFVPMTRVAEEFGGIDVSDRRPFSSIKRGYTQFGPGDVLFAKITPCMENGKIAIVPDIRPPIGYGSTEFFVMRPRADGIGPWIAYCIARSQFRELARQNMQGAVGQRRVPKVWLQDVSVPLAPLPEQHRIVARIESLFVRLDEGGAALKRVEANLKRYEASVVKAAVEGRLTEQWRSENPPDETGPELLGRILTERRRRWEEEQLAKYAAKGRKPPKNWKKKYKEPAEPDTGELPTLPDGWCWATVEQFASTASGGTPNRREEGYFGGGIPWVKSGELKDGPVLTSAETISDRGLAASSAKVFPAGTLCIALYGATVGKLGLLGMHAATNQAVCGVLSPISVLPKYLYFSLRAIRPDLIQSGQGGAQPNISQQIVRQTAVPVPPLSEQEAIIATLDAQLSAVQQTSGDALSSCLASSRPSATIHPQARVRGPSRPAEPRRGARFRHP